ncbi:FecCD family ABC transporter permease [Chengkuizengella axinellae]|uniref:Iron ABC transporter permease n=1 Tax=Chengkuizengella axinellae TaxID=3064388 RepID=A0ABT9J0S0_9BACL|nr:iron ABC transporter permease [Chengkuizengella sp. 2205SS18-9]MDP5275215.1 iron ABC transporter permease [Chengkuizengella sp. 2205SS18-9]
MKHKLFVWGGAGILLLLLSIVLSLSMGSAHIPVSQVWRILLHQLPIIGQHIPVDWPVSSEKIILQVRFPRIILGIIVGACLSLAGAGFQGVLRNPLADPFTLGVATGASVGASFLILFGLQFLWLGQWTVPIVAFLSGMLSLLFVFKLAGIQGKFRVETVILSGVVVQAFLGSIVSFMITLSDDVINRIIFWLMGSLALRGWDFSIILVPYFLIGLMVLLGHGRVLNLFALGERQAAHLGVNVDRSKWIVLIFSTLISAAAVSVAGVIGFVGLIVPHLVRLLVGSDYRLILPLSVVFGAIYVLWADTIARMLLSPQEIPLGVITALIGAPFFAYLLSKNKKASNT